jgi:hypothetical protein
MQGMRGELVDVTELAAAWNSSWSDAPPVARRLRYRFTAQRVRFHALPDAKRYATSDIERAEILRRHHTLLEALLGDARSDAGSLVAITCSWSATSSPTPRDQAVAATTPDAIHWRSDNLATEPGFQSWQHHYASRMDMTDPALDQLLVCVANDMTDEVILTRATCAWVYHPYDGGAEVFAGSTEDRDRLAAAHADWLCRRSPRAERLAEIPLISPPDRARDPRRQPPLPPGHHRRREPAQPRSERANERLSSTNETTTSSSRDVRGP